MECPYFIIARFPGYWNKIAVSHARLHEQFSEIMRRIDNDSNLLIQIKKESRLTVERYNKHLERTKKVFWETLESLSIKFLFRR